MEIEVKLAKFTGVIMRYEYTVRLAKSGETASVGHTEHCFVNDKFKPMSLRRKFPEYFDRLKSNISPEE